MIFCRRRMSSLLKSFVELGGIRRGRYAHDLFFFFARGIVDEGLEHEAVELRRGEVVGTLLLDGVLRGEHEERHGHRMALAARGDLSLFHGLKHRCLGLGRGSVDFVGEDDVGEDRAFEEFEAARGVAFFLDDNLGADDGRWA